MKPVLRATVRLGEHKQYLITLLNVFLNKGRRKSNGGGNEQNAKQSDPSSSYNMEQLIVDISITKKRLEHLLSNLQSRDKDLMRRISGAQEARDEFKFQRLARELLQIRKIANLTVYSSYMLEVVRLRLDTIKFVSSEILPALKLVQPIVLELKETLSKVSPGSEFAIKEIENDLADVMVRMNLPETPQVPTAEVTNAEVRNILKDVQKMALDKINSSFPEVPELNEVMAESVLEYVKIHKVDFNLEAAERDLPLSRNQIIAVLKLLESKDRIHIEYGTEEEHVI